MLFSVACLAAFLFSACGGDDKKDTVDCTGSTPTYDNNVKAILDANCAVSGCHDNGTKADGYDYSSYATARAVAVSKKTELLGSINHTSGFEKMPQGFAKLSAAEIKTITCWVENGAPQ